MGESTALSAGTYSACGSATWNSASPNPPFIRVHRSHIVNLDYVERIVGLDGARFEVVMKNGAAVPVSRARSQEFRQLSR